MCCTGTYSAAFLDAGDLKLIISVCSKWNFLHSTLFCSSYVNYHIPVTTFLSACPQVQVGAEEFPLAPMLHQMTFSICLLPYGPVNRSHSAYQVPRYWAAWKALLYVSWVKMIPLPMFSSMCEGTLLCLWLCLMVSTFLMIICPDLTCAWIQHNSHVQAWWPTV